MGFLGTETFENVLLGRYHFSSYMADVFGSLEFVIVDWFCNSGTSNTRIPSWREKQTLEKWHRLVIDVQPCKEGVGKALMLAKCCRRGVCKGSVQLMLDLFHSVSVFKTLGDSSVP